MSRFSAVGKSNCSIALHTMTLRPKRDYLISRKTSLSPTTYGLRPQQPIGSGMQPCACGGVPDAGALAPDCGGGDDGGGGGGGGNAVTTGAGACLSVGFGIAKVSVCSPFC